MTDRLQDSVGEGKGLDVGVTEGPTNRLCGPSWSPGNRVLNDPNEAKEEVD